MLHHRHRGLGLLVALGLLVGVLAPAGVTARTLPNYRPVAAPSWVTSPQPDFSRLDKAASSEATAAAQAGTGANPDYTVGDTQIGLSLNDVTGSYFATTFTVKAIGEHIEVWVQNSHNFPTGDPRNPVTITDDEIAYLVNQFDTNIYPKESEFWRTPATRDGTNAVLDDIFGLPSDAYVSHDGKDRVIAMVSNVRDANYYDPTFPVYIAGFFSSTINAYLDRNVITIDAYDWANRVGPNTSPWRDANPNNDRPYLYEGTFAHEYQHLLHADQNPGEESWVNEGLSDWTEWLVGYGIPDGHWDTAQRYAENSLTSWGDQGQGTEILADYGEAFLFMHYLYSRYGEAAMHALFDDQLFGIAGFNDALKTIGVKDNFYDFYNAFAIARLVLGKATGPTKGAYNIPDIPFGVQLFNPDGTINTESFSTPGAPPNGTDYLVYPAKGIRSFLFNGADLLTKTTPWTSVADPLATANGAVLWSGAGDEQDRFAIFQTTGGGSLTFDTLYDLEEQWDFGFVQVSTDNGATWTSLSNADTRTDIVAEGYPAIKDQLTTGGGFTGLSNGDGSWTHESFDLSGFSGSILVAFRFMSDWGTNGNGVLADPNWYIDNVAVDGTPVSDGTDASVFKDITFYQPIDLNFNVDLVSVTSSGGSTVYRVFHLLTDSATEQSDPVAVRKALSTSKYAVLLVTYDAAQGQSDYADYTVSVLK